MSWQPDYLEDDIIKILPLKESDFESLYQVASDPLIWEQHPAKNRCEREVFRQFFDDAINTKSAFVIQDKKSQKLIGSTRFYDFDSEDSSIALGYTFLSREFWGGEYNKLVKKLLLDYAFQFVDKVYFHIGETNFRSQAAIKKIGAKQDGVLVFDLSGNKSSHLKFVIHKENCLI
jgi:RimJ/RimL family protein N-acetyltransferase